jgi:hypothetical protein
MAESDDAAMRRVLALVAEGRLSADEAAPILDALSGSKRGRAEDHARRPLHAPEPPAPPEPPDMPGVVGGSRPRFARIQVIESGRRAVDLRVPVGLGRFALSKVPGLSPQQIDELQDALASGSHGPILDVQDVDGDGVRISLE